MDNISKQEHDFICFLIAGQTQRQAYKNAFKVSKKWKDKTVDNKASELFNSKEIQGRYYELLKETKNKASNMAIWSREQAFSEYEWLKDKAKNDINENGVKQANSTAFLNAVSGMNDMAFKDVELSENKLKKEIQYLETKINKLRGISDEIEDLEDLETRIYGDEN
nr:MAG TPA: DNA binding domain protein [Caudoviricetes sp.]